MVRRSCIEQLPGRSGAGPIYSNHEWFSSHGNAPAARAQTAAAADVRRARQLMLDEHDAIQSGDPARRPARQFAPGSRRSARRTT